MESNKILLKSFLLFYKGEKNNIVFLRTLFPLIYEIFLCLWKLF